MKTEQISSRVIADADSASLPAVRAAVREVLEGWMPSPRRDDVLLVVDELVANAGRHVGGEVVVDLTLEGSTVRVAVVDQDPDFRATTRPASSDRYGLRIVDVSSDRWGVSPIVGEAPGKVVWAEFELD